MVQSASVDASAAKIKQVSTPWDVKKQLSCLHLCKPDALKAAAGIVT